MKFADDLRNLDRHDVGGWPKSVKVFFMVVLFLVVVLAGWYLHVRGQQSDLADAQHTETKLKHEFTRKHAKAANLHKLENRLVDMKQQLRHLLRQLPSKTQMPKLLSTISRTALAAGIDTEVFKPQREVPKDFYAEQPIKLKMIGDYNEFGTFISDVASLPHMVILTMHDVSLTPVKKAPEGADTSSGKLLVLQGTVNTYRYLEGDDDSGHDGKGGK